jgi:putative transcription antitermination factor YqgF
MIFTTVEDFLISNNPLKGEILCVDVGAKKTGIATSVGGRKIAIPSTIIYETSQILLATKIINAMKERDCEYIILGYPFGWEEGESAIRIINLAKTFDVPVLLYDEGRTSVKVKQTIFDERGKMTKKEMQRYDMQVASLILSNAIDEINSFNI